MTYKTISGATLGLLLAGSFAVSVAQRSNEADTLLGKGLHQEEVEGNCREAIKTYQKVISQKNAPRNVAARAQLHVGVCQEKLGQREARVAYDLLVSRYPDQTDLVAEARARIAAMGGSQPPASGIRKTFIPIVTSARPNVADASVSSDGRYVAYKDATPNDQYTIVVLDRMTGQPRPVSPTANGPRTEDAWGPLLSPDGKQLVYTWEIPDNGGELRLVNLQEPGIPRHRKLLAAPYVKAYSWTPDGRNVVVGNGGQSPNIDLVSVVDGSSKRLVTEMRDWSAILVSPDGQYLARDHESTGGGDQFDIFIQPLNGGPEVPIVPHPADDQLLGWSPDSKSLLFISDRTGTYDLYSVALSNGRALGQRPSLLQSNVGRIDGLGVTSTGGLVYYERPTQPAGIKELEIANFNWETGELGKAVQIGAERNALNSKPAWSRDGKFLAYISQPSGGQVSIMIRSQETGATRELRPNVRPAELDWSPDGRSLLTTERTRARIVRIDVQTGETTTLVNGSELITARWSLDGSKVYFKRIYQNSRGGAAFIERDLATGQDREIIYRPEGAGAMLLSPDGKYLVTGGPTVIPVSGGTQTLLTSPCDVRNSTLQMWTPDSRALIVGGPDCQARVPLEGTPTKFPNGLPPDSDKPAVHPDGKQIAIVQTTTPPPGIWLLENFLPPAVSAKK